MAAEVVIRELGPEDAPAAWDLARLAFGIQGSPPAAMGGPTPGVTRWGAFDRAGRLVGKANDLHHRQWWGGVTLPAADVGGVAVAAEHRGAGTSRALLRHLLEAGRARGAAVSALYPTVSAVYRAAGWGLCGALRTVDLPTALLGRHRPEDGFDVRPGTPADQQAALDLYTEVARGRDGLLTRTGAPFASPGATGFDDVDGITVVEEAGRPVGFASWQRGAGYGSDAVLTVQDLIATSAPAARALVGVLASWRNVAPTVRFRALLAGPVTDALPLEAAVEHHAARWMLRPVDVVRAVTDRPCPAWVHAAVRIELVDDLAPWNAGRWALEIADGEAHLDRTTGEPALRFGSAGFALLYAGRATPATLVERGLAEAGAGGDAGAVGALGVGAAAALLDYF